MKYQRNRCLNIIKKMVTTSLSIEANSGSCIIFYQPKVPATLKKFSKIENDK